MIRPLKNQSLEANVTSRASVPLITSEAHAEGPRLHSTGHGGWRGGVRIFIVLISLGLLNRVLTSHK